MLTYNEHDAEVYWKHYPIRSHRQLDTSPGFYHYVRLTARSDEELEQEIFACHQILQKIEGCYVLRIKRYRHQYGANCDFVYAIVHQEYKERISELARINELNSLKKSDPQRWYSLLDQRVITPVGRYAYDLPTLSKEQVQQRCRAMGLRLRPDSWFDSNSWTWNFRK